MRRSLTVGVVGLVLVGTIVSCGDDDDSSDIADANAEFCTDLSAYRRAVADLAALDPATDTKEAYEDAVSEVRSTREEMVDSGADLAEAEWDNLQTQVDELRDTLADAPDDQTVQAILTEAQPQLAAVEASAATVNNAICPVGGPATTGGG